MKITEYPTAQFFDENDVLIKDGTNGTKQIKASDVVYAMFDPIPEMHGQIFRGKSLGSTFTTAQQQAIENGTFHDLWIGDYWTYSGVNYRIVDFDYFTSVENSKNRHHVVIMPDSTIGGPLTADSSNKANFVYSGSNFVTSPIVTSALSTAITFFGEDSVLEFKDTYSSATYKRDSASIYDGDRQELAYRIAVPEAFHFIGPYSGTINGMVCSAQPFKLFTIRRDLIRSSNGKSYWTRTPYGMVLDSGVRLRFVNCFDESKSVSLAQVSLTKSTVSVQTIHLRPIFVVG